jgi:hypothetical protein
MRCIKLEAVYAFLISITRYDSATQRSVLMYVTGCILCSSSYVINGTLILSQAGQPRTPTIGKYPACVSIATDGAIKDTLAKQGFVRDQSLCPFSLYTS